LFFPISLVSWAFTFWYFTVCRFELYHCLLDSWLLLCFAFWFLVLVSGFHFVLVDWCAVGSSVFWVAFICGVGSNRFVKRWDNAWSYTYIPPIRLVSRDNSVGIALGYGLDDRGSRVRFPGGLGIFLFTTASRTALGPTQSPIQWVQGALSLEVKLPGREADYSPPFSAEVKEWVELYLHSQYTFMVWCLVKHRDFTFTFTPIHLGVELN
jgi:hypothetical protein